MNDKLPDYFLIIDILKKGKFLNRQKKIDFCTEYGFYQVPFIYEGYINLNDLINFIPTVSSYGNRAEGIVVKRYRKKEYMRGKIVWPEFIKELDDSEHWTRKKLKINKLVSMSGSYFPHVPAAPHWG